jgi:dihydrofolate synthase/folylpolyglutamate synthase
MTHREYLFSLEHVGIKLGLDQIRGLLDHLDHPERACPTIVVAGTNGKGSVVAMVERALRAAGARTGRFTSPHLVALEERFAIDGESVTPAALDAAAGRVRRAAGHLASPPSFFEATTAAAFELFREHGVQIAVLEVGLGGRLDATNVTTPVGVAITAIGLDHEAHLGHTLPAIAAEKAGVIGSGSLVVLADNGAEIEAVVRAATDARNGRLLRARDDVSASVSLAEGRTRLTLATPRHDYGTITLGLRGRHQVENAIVAARLLEELSADGVWHVAPDAVRTGLQAAVWPGRLDLRSWRGVPVLIDGAHNPSGADALAAYVLEVYGRPLPMVVAIMGDKAIDDMIRALGPAASRIVFTAPASLRAAAPATLAARAAVVMPAVPVTTADRPMEALERAAADASPAAPVVVAGSLYLAGDVLAEIA